MLSLKGPWRENGGVKFVDLHVCVDSEEDEDAVHFHAIWHTTFTADSDVPEVVDSSGCGQWCGHGETLERGRMNRTVPMQFATLEVLTSEMTLTLADDEFEQLMDARTIDDSVPKKKLRESYEAGKLTDFILTSSDNKHVKVHRIILASNGAVLEAMLLNDTTKESLAGLCEIADVEYETLKIVVDHLYGADVTDHLLAADKYGLDELRQLCMVTMKSQLSLPRILGQYTFAQHHKLLELKDAIVRFVQQHYSEFLEMGGIAKLMREAPFHYVDFLKLVSAAGSKKRTASKADL